MWNHILSTCALALYTFYFGVSGLPQEKLNERIIGGSMASLHEAPYIASILMKTDKYQHRCGGSVISKRHILSAAHCFLDVVSKFSARMGSDNNHHGGIIIPVKTIITHPTYNQHDEYDADIAVLELMRDVPFDKFHINTVKLPSLQVSEGDILTVFGWGITETQRPSQHLRKVNVPVVNWQDCRNRYVIHNVRITPNMFCASCLKFGGIDACQGDSGGPIAKNDVIYGIVSFGYDCGSRNFPGVYTDVMKFIPWIQSHIHT